MQIKTKWEGRCEWKNGYCGSDSDCNYLQKCVKNSCSYSISRETDKFDSKLRILVRREQKTKNHSRTDEILLPILLLVCLYRTIRYILHRKSTMDEKCKAETIKINKVQSGFKPNEYGSLSRAREKKSHFEIRLNMRN